MRATHKIGPYRIRVIHAGRGKWLSTVALSDNKSLGFSVYPSGRRVEEPSKGKLLRYLESAHGCKALQLGRKHWLCSWCAELLEKTK